MARSTTRSPPAEPGRPAGSLGAVPAYELEDLLGELGPADDEVGQGHVVLVVDQLGAVAAADEAHQVETVLLVVTDLDLEEVVRSGRRPHAGVDL